jgi:hypothetical protein
MSCASVFGAQTAPSAGERQRPHEGGWLAGCATIGPLLRVPYLRRTTVPRRALTDAEGHRVSLLDGAPCLTRAFTGRVTFMSIEVTRRGDATRYCSETHPQGRTYNKKLRYRMYQMYRTIQVLHGHKEA